MTKQTRNAWWLTGALLVLSAVPVGAGMVRLHELGSGGDVTAENARFFAAPMPVVLHIIAATLFSVLGALQFIPRSGWHRKLGWLVAVSGVVVALSGLWMTLFYPRPEGDGVALTWLRLIFGAGMLVSIVLSVASIVRRNVSAHSAWMMRGYAIGMGAGTQVLTHVPFFILFGKPDELGRTLLMAAGWVINLAVVEWSLRRRSPPRQRATDRQHGSPASQTEIAPASAI